MPPHLASAPNINHLWAALLVEELVRQGTTFFVVCPGSRSTPLAVAVAQNPRAEALVHWDERAAAFVALGWGRATGRPAAVVTTSGTAVANLLPAAVEADADGVPMLLLTADRPPELRETGANQTVRQPPVFQDVARWALDWPVPTASVPARWVLSTAAHAVHRALGPAGPVHLNLPFREPLAAVPDGTDVEAYLNGVGEWAGGSDPYATLVRPDPWTRIGDADAVPAGLVEKLLGEPRGVVVKGTRRLGDERWVHDRRWTDPEWEDVSSLANHLARLLGWPYLEDVRSQAKLGSRGGAHYDLALGSERFRESHGVRAVVHVGGSVVSKRLAQHLRSSRPSTYVHVREHPARFDPDALVTHVVAEHEGAFLRTLVRKLEERRPGASWGTSWQESWNVASAKARAAAGAEANRSGLSEPAVARAVRRRAPSGWGLVLAASMPIRDVGLFTGFMGGWLHVVANRGASGIDGTVATAAGFARGARQPAVLLVGDLALLHDQTSLALLRDAAPDGPQPPVVVVCINNDGGGIFHRLPIAQGEGALSPETFEQMFGTPHGLGFEDAARQFGLAYHRPETTEAFEAALDTALRSGASALIEVRTDREEQAALRRRIEAAAAAAVDAALVGSDG